jgi:hypothetical protein
MNTRPPGELTVFPRLKTGANGSGEKCGTCRHWMQGPVDPQNLKAPRPGLCQLNPPVPIMLGLQQMPGGQVPRFGFVRPETTENEHCGQHAADLTI